MADHECERCGRCCTEPEIFITLGDIYRIRSAYRASMKMYDFFRSITDGWAFAPASKPDQYWPIPKAKKPCPFLGGDGPGSYRCTVYDTRFVLCGGFPDEYFLGPQEGHPDPERLVRFHESLECTRGFELTPERRERAEAIRELFNDEIEMTGMLLVPRAAPGTMLHPKLSGIEVPIQAYSTGELDMKLKRIAPGLNMMMKSILTKKENIRKLKENLTKDDLKKGVNKSIMKRYRELYPVDW